MVWLGLVVCLGLQRGALGAGRVSPKDVDELLSPTIAVVLGVTPVHCRGPWTVLNPS